ncbi:MAG: hypothetical protein ABI205_06420 [Gemmatimonadaceae bacterium]
MRRAWLLLLLCGCASGGNSSTISSSQPVIFQGDQGTLLGDAALSSGADVDAPPATTWLAVKKVYADMEIPLTLEDAPGHQLGNKNFYKTHQMAGQSMAQFVDCGNGMTGPNALSFRIYISSITTVTGNAKGGSNVQTIFIPQGQDMGGTSSDRIPCGSTGRFEALLLQRVAAVIGK